MGWLCKFNKDTSTKCTRGAIVCVCVCVLICHTPSLHTTRDSHKTHIASSTKDSTLTEQFRANNFTNYLSVTRSSFSRHVRRCLGRTNTMAHTLCNGPGYANASILSVDVHVAKSGRELSLSSQKRCDHYMVRAESQHAKKMHPAFYAVNVQLSAALSAAIIA